MSDKFRRIGAWVGIALLVGMYILTLIAAIFSSEASAGLFVASLYCTFVVPVWIFVLQLFYKRSHPEGSISKRDIKRVVAESLEAAKAQEEAEVQETKVPEEAENGDK